jgi:hypothetical protein
VLHRGPDDLIVIIRMCGQQQQQESALNAALYRPD